MSCYLGVVNNTGLFSVAKASAEDIRVRSCLMTCGSHVCDHHHPCTADLRTSRTWALDARQAESTQRQCELSRFDHWNTEQILKQKCELYGADIHRRRKRKVKATVRTKSTAKSERVPTPTSKDRPTSKPAPKQRPRLHHSNPTK